MIESIETNDDEIPFHKEWNSLPLVHFGLSLANPVTFVCFPMERQNNNNSFCGLV
jgi:hypothetical protein